MKPHSVGKLAKVSPEHARWGFAVAYKDSDEFKSTWLEHGLRTTTNQVLADGSVVMVVDLWADTTTIEHDGGYEDEGGQFVDLNISYWFDFDLALVLTSHGSLVWVDRKQLTTNITSSESEQEKVYS